MKGNKKIKEAEMTIVVDIANYKNLKKIVDYSLSITKIINSTEEDYLQNLLGFNLKVKSVIINKEIEFAKKEAKRRINCHDEAKNIVWNDEFKKCLKETRKMMEELK